MMRHVHSLRQPVVSMLLKVVDILIAGGAREAEAKGLQPQGDAEAAQPMETDGDEVSSAPTNDAARPSTSGTTAQRQLSLYVIQKTHLHVPSQSMPSCPVRHSATKAARKSYLLRGGLVMLKVGRGRRVRSTLER